MTKIICRKTDCLYNTKKGAGTCKSRYIIINKLTQCNYYDNSTLNELKGNRK